MICYYSGFRTNGTTFTFKVIDERVWGSEAASWTKLGFDTFVTQLISVEK